MPWHIAQDHPDCTGYAVIKDATNEVVGCHKTEEQAIRQLAALHIAEPNVRAGNGPAAIIVDIDGTLELNGRVNNQLVRYLNGRSEIKIIVTARNENSRESTIAFLETTGLRYRGLNMSPGGNSTTYKRGVAKRLMRNHDIVLAVDNNPEIRAMYQDLGIETMSPTARRDAALEILATLHNR